MKPTHISIAMRANASAQNNSSPVINKYKIARNKITPKFRVNTRTLISHITRIMNLLFTTMDRYKVARVLE